MSGRTEREWLEPAADVLTAPPTPATERRVAEQLTRSFRARGTAYQDRGPGRRAEQRIWPVGEQFDGRRGEVLSWSRHLAPTAHPLLRYYLSCGVVRPMQVRDVPDHVADQGVRAEFGGFSGELGMAHQLALPVHHAPGTHRAFVLARPDPFSVEELELARTLHRLPVAFDRQLSVLLTRVVQPAASEVVLTARELAVLALVADGLTAAAIARCLIHEVYEAFGRGDMPAVLSMWQPDIVWTEPEGATYPGTFHGSQAVVDGVFFELGTAWTDFTVTPEEYLDAGDAVVVLGHYTGSYDATGRSFRVRFAHVVRVRDGLVAAFEAFADTKLFADATG